MQRTLHFTRQPGSRASSSASSSTSSSFNPQSTRHSTPLVPRRVRGSTASSPLPIDDDTESGNQDSVSREPPIANRNYGCIFPIDWDNLYLTTYGKLTGKYGYRVINKRLLLSKAPISPIWKHGADLFWDGPLGKKRLQLYKLCHLAQRPGALLTINGNDHINGHLKSKHDLIINPKSHSGRIQLPSIEASTSASSHERQLFWAAGYVQAYVNWIILQDITFR